MNSFESTVKSNQEDLELQRNVFSSDPFSTPTHDPRITQPRLPKGVQSQDCDDQTVGGPRTRLTSALECCLPKCERFLRRPGEPGGEVASTVDCLL